MCLVIDIKLEYYKDGLKNTHVLSDAVEFSRMNSDKLMDVINGKFKMDGLNKAVQAITKIIDGLKCSFTITIYANIVNTDNMVQSKIDFSLVPPEVVIARPGAVVERIKYDLSRQGKEEVKAVLRKEAKKIKGLYKTAALEALAEKAKKAEAR